MSLSHRITSLFPFLVAAAAPLSAQSQLLNIDGGSRGGNFGAAVAMMGDLNADGVPDFAVGIPNDDSAGISAGRVRFVNGATGATLFSVNGLAAGDAFGTSMANMGDIDGDGKPDLIVGAPFADPNGSSSGQVRVLSGANGATILTFNGANAGDRFGQSVAYGGSTGIFPVTKRLIVGAPYKDNGLNATGSVYLYTEAGALVHEWQGGQADGHFGWSVSGGSDTNGDGIEEVFAGMPNFDGPFTEGGAIVVYSGAAPFSLITAFSGNSADQHTGWCVTFVSDANNDGIPDLAWSAPDFLNGKGTIWCYSGVTGGNPPNLYAKTGHSDGDHFGKWIASAGDVNNDGRGDLLVGAPDSGSGGGSVYLYSPVNFGTLLASFTGSATGDHFGAAISGGIDLTGDGNADFVIGSPDATPDGAAQGNVRVFNGSTHAQLLSVDGPVSGDQLGYSVCSIGDVNGDGHADFLIGSPRHDHTTFLFGTTIVDEDSGSVRCVSGATGATLWTIYGAEGDELGFSLANIGDVNGDGKSDFVVGAPQTKTGTAQPGYAKICSGANGGTIATVAGIAGTDTEFGYAVGSMPDVTGDGLPEVIIGSPGYSTDRGRAVRVNSGTWVIGLNWFGVDNGERFGTALTAIGDANNDGKPDVLIGAPSNDAVAANAGRAYCRSGIANTTLFTLSGAAAGELFGTSMCALTLDIYPAFAVGAPGVDYLPSSLTDIGMVRVYNTANQVPYSTIYGSGNYSYFGSSLANIGDYNHDGFDDYAVGSTESLIFAPGQGQVQVVSGYYGAVQYTFDGGAAGDFYGTGLAAAGDVDADGTLDLLVGSPFADPNGSSSGNVKAISLHPQGITYYGASTPGCNGPQTLHASSAAKVGAYWLIHGITNTPPGALGLMLVTDSQDAIGHDVFAIGIPLYVDFAFATQVYGLDVYGTYNGHGLVITSIPNSPFLAGTHYYLQTVWAWSPAQCLLPPFNLSSSQAEEMVIQP